MFKSIFLLVLEMCFLSSGTFNLVRSEEVKFQIERPQNPSATHSPRILSSPSQLSVLEGDTVVFPCRVSKSNKFVLMWKRGKSKLLFAGLVPADNDKKYSLVDETSLQIDSVTAQYADEYTCFINSNSRVELTHVLRVLVPPKITLDPADGHVIVKGGDPVLAKCNAEGYPQPVVTWKALKGNLPGGAKEKQGNVLTIASADTEHTGIYECRADNGVGNADTGIVRIKVLYPPEITVTPIWVHAGLGSNVEFRCMASAEPMATLIWTRAHGTILQEDGHIVFQHAPRSLSEDMLILKIRRVAQEHFGSYACFANNSLGSGFRTAEISGLAEPVKFRSNASSDEEESFLLSWTVKSYSPIIEYMLRIRQQKSKDSSSRSSSWHDVMIPVEIQQSVLHSQSYNVTGLEVATGYEVVMQARNDFGWNHPSETFTFYTLGGEPLSDAVDDVTSEQTLENIVAPGEPLQKEDVQQEILENNSSPQIFSSSLNLLFFTLCFCIRLLEW